jgi:hypothetical protein
MEFGKNAARYDEEPYPDCDTDRIGDDILDLRMAAGHKALMHFIKNPKGRAHEKSGGVAEASREFLNSMETEGQKPSEYGECKNVKSFISVTARKIEWQFHGPRGDIENETIVQGGGQERKNGFQKFFQDSISGEAECVP